MNQRRVGYSSGFGYRAHRKVWLALGGLLTTASVSACSATGGSAVGAATTRPGDEVQSSQEKTSVSGSSATTSTTTAPTTSASSGSSPSAVPSLPASSPSSPSAVPSLPHGGQPPIVVLTDADVQRPITVAVGTVIEARLTVDPAGGTIDPAQSDTDAVVHRTAVSAGLGPTSYAKFVATAVGHARLVAGEHFPCAAGVACAAGYALGFDVTVTPRIG
jgi:hypothetical protein